MKSKTYSPVEVSVVYEDEQGNEHWQPVSDIVESGTLTDPETEDDMPIVRVKVRAD